MQRVVIELFDDAVPRTARNFRELCEGSQVCVCVCVCGSVSGCGVVDGCHVLKILSQFMFMFASRRAAR